jgi:hypothetical protein
MLEFFHQRDLADGGGGSAFFGVEVDFLQGDELAGLAVAAFEDLFSRVRDGAARLDGGMWDEDRTVA